MKKLFKNGISIRVIHIAMLVCAAAIVGLLIYSTTKSSSVFTNLSSETENYIVRQKAAHDLMEASDYLTENVQRFTLNGDIKYMNQYFEEANVSQRRQNAINAMSENNADQSLIDQLNEALERSIELMEDEKLAMKLVIEAKKEVSEDPDSFGDLELVFDENEANKYPDAIEEYNLKDYNISDDNKGEHLDSLPPDEKMEKARELVMGSHYYAKKEEIRTSLKNALEMMDNQMAATRRKSSSDLMKDLTVNRVIIIILVVVLAALILLTAILITIPALAASRSVRKKERLPVGGAKEFRELTENYNDMFDKLQPPEDGE